MIRTLAPDELEWFIASYYDFLGHSNPRGFARQAVSAMRDRDAEADKSFIAVSDETEIPLAGVHVLAPEPEADDQNLALSNIWFKDESADLTALLRKVLAQHPHDAVHCPLFNFSDAKLDRVRPVFDALGFDLEYTFDLEFDLADLPPIGTPLVLEAWSDESDVLFRKVFSQAESYKPSDRQWSWFKRRRSKFNPNLWFIARETLDQDPVGYAFYGAYQEGIEGIYYLTAGGVMPEFRDSTAMLRRLMISSMQELASRSPFGKIQTTTTRQDPKLLEILESLGFITTDKYPVFIRKPA